jgi:uncharacterized MAPEG superfamily protein
MNAVAATTYITMLGWSVVLLLAQIVAQAMSTTMDCGLPYAMSARDADDPRVSDLSKRLARALRNLLETYPAFVALALALAMKGDAGALGTWGAIIWFWARVAYVPIYAAGIPAIRTGVWTVSIVGLLMMLIALWS